MSDLYTLDQYLNDELPMDRFITHTGVTDLEGFEWWLKSAIGEKYRMVVRMKGKKNLNQEQKELLEYVETKLHTYREVLVNFRAATKSTVKDK